MFYALLPLAIALVAVLLFATPVRAKVWVATGVIVALAVAALVPSVGVLAGLLPDVQWSIASPVFGVEKLSIDALSALFLVVIAVAGIATVIYSKGYLSHYLDKKSSAHISLHYLSLVLLVAAMMGVVISSGGFSFLLAWELMTIASFVLILFDAQRAEVLRAALTYLVMMHVGFILLVAAFATTFSLTGEASFEAVSLCASSSKTIVLFVLFLLGFGMKAGMFPLHVWLPEAHPAAPSHVSAIMSGVMIKTGVYGVMRILWHLAEAEELYVIGMIILAVGIVTGVWGIILATTQNDMKRLLAYSSMENVGIIFIGLGIATLSKAEGATLLATVSLCGTLLHLVNHSLFKSLLFFGAGNIYSQTHTTHLDKLGGVAKYMPMTAVLFLVATVAICAMPPLNGFVGEFLIYLGMFDSVRWGVNVLPAAAGLIGLSLIGGFVVLAFSKLYSTVFLGTPRHHHVAESREVDNARIVAMAIPTIAILCIGLVPQYSVVVIERVALQFMPSAEPVLTGYITPTLFHISLVALMLILLTTFLYLLKQRAQRSRTIAEGPTWGCGFTSPNGRMQYTGESFAEGVESIATSITQQMVEGKAVGKGEIFPSRHTYGVRHKDKIDSLFAAWWVELLRQINKRIMSLRTGKINHYILFALLFLVAIFVLSLLNVI